VLQQGSLTDPFYTVEYYRLVAGQDLDSLLNFGRSIQEIEWGPRRRRPDSKTRYLRSGCLIDDRPVVRIYNEIVVPENNGPLDVALDLD